MSDLFKFLSDNNVELTLDRTNSTELELLAYDRIKDLEKKLAEANGIMSLQQESNTTFINQIRGLQDKLALAVEALKKINKETTPDHVNDMCNEALKQLSE